jgi:NADPH:quinone reductase-like Zn-dependent oxidoreductase
MRTSCGTGAGLRNKAQIVQEVIKNVWPEIESGKVKIVIDEVFPLGKAAEAHHAMERSHLRKLLLTC